LKNNEIGLITFISCNSYSSQRN